jgi:hypothetical protein
MDFSYLTHSAIVNFFLLRNFLQAHVSGQTRNSSFHPPGDATMLPTSYDPTIAVDCLAVVVFNFIYILT